MPTPFVQIAWRALRHTSVVSAVVLLLGPFSADAKTLYVNGASGNDATSYAANGASAPWRTIGRAAWGSTNRNSPNTNEAARAGDVVLVQAGTYSVAGTDSRSVPAYNPANEGTAGNPITFRANGGIVTLTLSSSNGTIIGSYDRDYITWDGFTIHEATAPSHSDTGPVTLFNCVGCVLQNLDINGNGNANGRQDNHNGIRVEDSRNLLIRNNRIQNVTTVTNVNNGAGIMVYGAGAVTFEHNEIFGCGSGIFIKGGPNNLNDYFTLRYNLIYNSLGNAIALHAGAPNRPEAPVRIYQNVLRNSGQSGVKIWLFDEVDPTNNPMNAKIVNNTIDNNPYGLWVDGNPLPNSGHVFWNNIVTNSNQRAIAYGGARSTLVESRFDSEHNMYFNYSTFAETVEGTFYTLASWKSTFNQDSASPASQNVNPLYTSATNYILQAASPARNAGIDFLDLDSDGSTADPINLGAYVTGAEVIGRTSGSAPPPVPPAAPTSVRILP